MSLSGGDHAMMPEYLREYAQHPATLHDHDLLVKHKTQFGVGNAKTSSALGDPY